MILVEVEGKRNLDSSQLEPLASRKECWAAELQVCMLC